MKQITQDLKKGDTILEEVPAPHARPGAHPNYSHPGIFRYRTHAGGVWSGKSYCQGAATA